VRDALVPQLESNLRSWKALEPYEAAAAAAAAASAEADSALLPTLCSLRSR
jgi:hypothetical protein